jgi:hypothetical protein
MSQQFGGQSAMSGFDMEMDDNEIRFHQEMQQT